ncbi:ATP synthase subunit C [Gardnerella vaginalis]|jgi:ATP synthase F0, C subunit|uniref:ATP synthase F(0) sector subunit c n=6 Tax=Gardnerella TaxID=2701 RepID=A0A0J8FDH6_GARVA|nr:MULTISPECIES: ATP synthase F0 subunit C [Gardnerella]ADB14389.1 ATP synthase subunit C [Gardnerella vaginalis 409-05]EFH28033.1 F0F1-type ATP synthase, c subunit [Gardnerella vaginalis AMD]EPI43706.1 ATP synthase F0, C subunit [Gardnerella vaginalis JCP8522]EPI46901.1 ATP synthase F0, C subunit [Gardnerella vaginalis JCP8151A]EPI47040.1 ATP synthase F0, C subunit [Gardnerella vaginalis JCP8151B]EPI60119.1 ATP synthase F0, C subunit [Gardnerella vaginalis JCP8070]EPI60509.1 ATP synthase F0
MNSIIALAGLTGNLSILGFAVATLSPAIGMAMVVSKAMESTARQPEVGNRIQLFMFIGLAFIEVLGLLGFVAYIMGS